ncbi:MAG TPA: DUF2892 domain-containing protein [Puia sp.]|nr:DUF2892 domain-containing protein [Puia sp.]
MKTNMSNTDRIIRVIMAGTLLILWFEDLSLKGIPGTILVVIAGILAVTGFIGNCPLYMLLGIHSNNKKKTSEPYK